MGYADPKVLAVTGAGIATSVLLGSSLLIIGAAVLFIALALANRRFRRIS